MRKRGSLLFWFFDICGLQFGIVREVCCRLILVLRFGDLLSPGVLQRLDLICGSLFGLYAIGIWYFWTFSYLVCIWLFGFVFVRELFGIWVCEGASTLICIIPNLILWNLFVVTRGYRLLPNHVILGVLYLFFFLINFLCSYC